MEVDLRHSGLIMRPSLTADRLDIAEHIFGDVEVAKTLVHNVSSREGALSATDAWIDTLAVDGKRSSGNPDYVGLWTICDEANDNRFVGIRGVFAAPGLPKSSVATFVAVARTYWGQGVSGDSSRLLCGQVFEKSDLEAIYTRVWPKLNPASEAVQRRLGFLPAERHTLKDTFGNQRILEVLEYDLWRASRLKIDQYHEALRQISIRIGQLAAEDLLEPQVAVERIIASLPECLVESGEIHTQVAEDLRIGYVNPAWATYRMSRDTWAAFAKD